MTIDGVNGVKQIVPAETAGVQNSETTAKADKPVSVFIENKNSLAVEAHEIPKEIPMPENVAETEQMSRKEAKNWVKAYREEHGCSKKEAKAAFEQEFGYKMPSSNFTKTLRSYLITGNIPGLIVGFTHSAEERKNFVETGKWTQKA